MDPLLSRTGTAAVASYNAGEVARLVQDYRTSPSAGFYEGTETVLCRLQADPEGKVSAALNRLKPKYPQLLIFYLVQAVELAVSRNGVLESTNRKVAEYEQLARRARELAKDSCGQAPIELCVHLPKLADWFDERAKNQSEAPRRLHIMRKRHCEGADQMLAMRHFAQRLRMQRRNHDAIRWLVEAALGTIIPETRASEALRRSNGHSNPQATQAKNQNARKTLKGKGA